MNADWIVLKRDRDAAERLGAALGLRSLTAQLLINRGLDEPERARRYLAPRLADLRRPDEMWGFARAVERVDRALAEKEPIGIFGDYDVDGVTSCALLTQFLRDVGGAVVPRVARRDAGYGFSPNEVRAFVEAGCRVVVTCDLGTSDHEALAAARAENIDVIVVDHHQVPDREPDALALLNPHQPACRFPFKGLASVGVAFYLAAALRTRLRARGLEVPDPRELLDLVAIGTVADMAPLTDENRILVSSGLARLKQNARPGVRALMMRAGLDEGVRRAADIGLRLGPRLNAPGRLGAAQLSLDLLLAETDARADELANEAEETNERRREVQEKVVRAAIEEVEAGPLGDVIVTAGQGWHPGVVGIVASKLAEKFRRPAVVIALDGATGRGSARTVPGFDLYAAFKRCHDLLVRYGGHPAAAGLTVETARLPELRARLQTIAAEVLADRPPAHEVVVDAEVGLDAIDEPLAEEIRRLEPFGVGNREPVLGARGVLLERSRVVGERHLQVTLRDGEHARDGIGFNIADGAPSDGDRVRAAFFPELDTFRGVTRVRVRLRDLARESDA